MRKYSSAEASCVVDQEERKDDDLMLRGREAG